jgi:parallel beta-helix repeat protein
MFFGGSEGGVRGWSVDHNTVSSNSRAGLFITATEDSAFRNNTVVDNGLGGSAPGPTGGMVLREVPGFDLPTEGNLVTGNTVRHNVAFDIDATGVAAGNTITANACGTSAPPGLC